MAIAGSIKSQTIKLRKEGKSYSEINKLLGVAKSTLSGWLKDLPLSKNVKLTNITKNRLISARNIIDFNRQKSIQYEEKTKQLLEDFAKKVPRISKNDLYLIGLALFWAEGGKKEKWSVRFCNSDPIVIKVMMRFFREICETPNKKIKLRIHLYPNIEEKVATNFWSKLTKIPKNQFIKPQMQISKSSQNKRPFNRLPYGTLHIAISDVLLNRKIKGWLLGLSRQFDKE